MQLWRLAVRYSTVVDIRRLKVNLNGETKIMPFTIIFSLLWFYPNGISVPCQQQTYILLIQVRYGLSLPPLDS